jgi:asparagine synthase (glutamine-hydrolysing)
MIRDHLSADTLRRQGFLEPAVVESLIQRHETGQADFGRQLWNLLVFTLWYERYVEREAPGVATGATGATAAA